MLSGSRSLLDQLQHSSAGQFQRECSFHGQTSDLHTVCTKLPRVIVVGDANVGKTSVLKTVTGCGVFATETHTKVPVKLQFLQVSDTTQCRTTLSFRGQPEVLQSVQRAATRVASIMNDVEGITNDEINICIEQVEMPSCEFVDLPGIQAFPSQHFAHSIGLLSKYIKDADTIVLCVVNATSPALGSTALKMVREAKRLPRTILVLSQSELVRSEQQIQERVFDRLLRQSRDCQHLEGLADCVAVASCHCKHQHQTSDPGYQAEEQHIFSNMIRDAAPAYISEAAQHQLRDSMSTSQLIVKLDKMYHEHVVQQWAPAAVAKTRRRMRQYQSQLEMLGPAPQSLTKEAVLQAVCSQVDYGGISQTLRDIRVMVNESHGQIALSAYQLPQCVWATHAWAEAVSDAETKLPQAVESFLESQAYLATLQRAFVDAWKVVNPLQLSRFTTLHRLLQSHLLPTYIADRKMAARPMIDQIVRVAVMQLQSEHPPEDVFQKLDSGVCGCLIKHTLCGLKQSSFQLPSDFQLTEEDNVQSMRTQLDSQLLQLQLLLDKLLCVEDMFNPVACGGPWWEAAHQASVDPADFGSASNGDSESPTHAAVWESVHRALHQQQLLQQQLEPFTATLVPVDPAGNNLSSSALLGSGPQAHNSLPPASLSSKSAPLSVLPAAACAQVEADLESVTLTSAPKPAWEGSEDSFSWVESEGSHIHQDAMQFPFAF